MTFCLGLAVLGARHCVRTQSTVGSCSPLRGWEPTRNTDASIECTRLQGQECSSVPVPSDPPRKARVRVHFTGCAKNVAPSLSATAHNVELLGNQVRDYSVTVYLDTSTDGSEDALRGWVARNERVTGLLSTTVVSPDRTTRLAFCRNVCLREALRPTGTAGDPAAELVAVVDLDCPPVMAVAHFRQAVDELSLRSRWDALTANSMPNYYDLCAIAARVTQHAQASDTARTRPTPHCRAHAAP